MNKKIISFSIFENGENLSEIKSRAIDKMKSIKNISETEALDIVSKEINKLPFEKAFFNAKDESPFTLLYSKCWGIYIYSVEFSYYCDKACPSMSDDPS